jgi:hypothetical protein
MTFCMRLRCCTTSLGLAGFSFAHSTLSPCLGGFGSRRGESRALAFGNRYSRGGRHYDTTFKCSDRRLTKMITTTRHECEPGVCKARSQEILFLGQRRAVTCRTWHALERFRLLRRRPSKIAQAAGLEGSRLWHLIQLCALPAVLHRQVHSEVKHRWQRDDGSGV